jgi:hypothetical protein
LFEDIKTRHGGRSRGRWKKARQHAHRRRLPGTVWPQEPDDLALRHLKRNLINSYGVRILLGERLSLDHK